MAKRKLNLILDQDLIEYAKAYEAEQKTTVSEVFTQLILNLKRRYGEDCGFREALMATMESIEAEVVGSVRNSSVEVGRSAVCDTSETGPKGRDVRSIANEIIGSWKGKPLRRADEINTRHDWQPDRAE